LQSSAHHPKFKFCGLKSNEQVTAQLVKYLLKDKTLVNPVFILFSNACEKNCLKVAIFIKGNGNFMNLFSCTCVSVPEHDL
jgi:hypothetical protein